MRWTGGHADHLTFRRRRFFSHNYFRFGGDDGLFPDDNTLVITARNQQAGNESQHHISNYFPFHAYSLSPFMLRFLS
jgi:hypothetical protein